MDKMQGKKLVEQLPDKTIMVLGHLGLSLTDARQLHTELGEVLKSCNVANKNRVQSVEDSLFGSADSGGVFTVYINDDNDFETMRAAFKTTHAIVSVIDALMQFHSDQEALNIIIAKQVMEGRAKSYMFYPDQFAQQIAKRTMEYLKIKCIYHQTREIMGVFCRKSDLEISVTFRGQLLNELQQHGKANVDTKDIPESYLAYPATLVAFLRKRFPDQEVDLQKSSKIFKFSIKKTS